MSISLLPRRLKDLAKRESPTSINQQQLGAEVPPESTAAGGELLVAESARETPETVECAATEVPEVAAEVPEAAEEDQPPRDEDVLDVVISGPPDVVEASESPSAPEGGDLILIADPPPSPRPDPPPSADPAVMAQANTLRTLKQMASDAGVSDAGKKIDICRRLLTAQTSSAAPPAAP